VLEDHLVGLVLKITCINGCVCEALLHHWEDFVEFIQVDGSIRCTHVHHQSSELVASELDVDLELREAAQLCNHSFGRDSIRALGVCGFVALKDAVATLSFSNLD